MKTKAMVMMIAALVVAMVVGAVSAQDNPDGRRGRPRVDMVRELTEIITEATGLTAQDIRQQVNDGATLVEVIETNGGSVETVIADAVAAITERVNEAQENGDIPEERATQILENLEQHVTDFLNGEGRLPRGGRPDNGRRGERNSQARRLVTAVAESTGLEAQDIVTLVQEGASLADVLTNNGVDVNTFIAEQAATVEERLNEQVEGGQINQAVADARLNLFRVELDFHLNRVMEAPTE